MNNLPMKKMAWLLLGPLTVLADPNTPTLELQGRINPQISYRIQVDFATTVNDHACQTEDYITGMWIAQREMAFVAAELSGGEHHARVALEHAAGAGPCGWRPAVLSVCVGPRATPETPSRCQPLYLIQNDVRAAPKPVVMRCDMHSWICTSAEGAAVPRQEITIGNKSLTLDIEVTPAAAGAAPTRN